jgi:hypothetical protein
MAAQLVEVIDDIGILLFEENLCARHEAEFCGFSLCGGSWPSGRLGCRWPKRNRSPTSAPTRRAARKQERAVGDRTLASE